MLKIMPHGNDQKQCQTPGLMALIMLPLVLSGCAATGGDTSARSLNSERAAQALSTASGHSYLYYPMPESDRTAVAITWHSDIANLPAGKESLPRLGIDLMLNGGAGGLPAEEIIADFEDLDSGSDLWVQPQEVTGFIVSPMDHVARASEIANLVMTKPNLEQKWFEREKKIFVDSAVERDVLAAGKAWNLFREVTLGDHPYKQFWSLRPLDSIKSIKLQEVKDWHANAFSRKALTITVAGNADLDAINDAIDTVLTDMPDTERTAMIDFPGPDIQSKTILFHAPDAEKSIMLIVGDLPSHSEEIDIALQLGVGVLGWGKQSRLFNAVRTELRAAYGFGAGVWDMTREHRVLHLSGEIETGKAQQVMDAVRNSYEKFRTGGINLIEFPIARKFYVQRVEEEFEKPSSIAYLMMDAKLNGFSDSYTPGLIQNIKSQKRADVNGVIEQSLPSFESMLKIVVSPDANAIAGACVITAMDQWSECD